MLLLFKILLLYLSMWSIEGKLNFLFIIVDDLRPALGCYGDKNARTPNIDLLAKESIVFTQAFAQQSLCAPSRNSLLTGRRPDTLRLYDFYSYWRNDIGNFTTLPEHLKNNGYTTMSIGKVFHPGISSNGSDDSPYSWSEKPFHPYTDNYKNVAVCYNKNSSLARNLVCPVHVSLMPNKTLPDIETLNEAKKFLKEHKNSKKPFFLAVGFQKPHIPLKYPQKFLKLHSIEKFTIMNYTWPKNVNSIAYNPWTDLRKRDDVKSLLLTFPWEKIPLDFAKQIIQSYYAAVSYIDDLIGRLLNQLKTLSLKKNTIVILTSDHGWSLGEHAEWAKYSNFDVALHVPLIVSIPDLTVNYDQSSNETKTLIFHPTAELKKNRTYETNTLIMKIPQKNEKLKNMSKSYVEDFSNKTKLNDERNVYKINNNCDGRRKAFANAIVELVDLFPTIADLAGFPITTCPADVNSNLCSEGSSFIPLIKATLLCQKKTWKSAAFSQYPRPGILPTLHPNSDKPRLKEINIMGYTLRTEKFRYVAWVRFYHDSVQPNWKEIIAEELYDHSVDPGEHLNIVTQPEYSKIRLTLKTKLQHGWRNISLI